MTETCREIKKLLRNVGYFKLPCAPKDATSKKVNAFLVNFPIFYPQESPENKRFLVFSGCIKWEHWPVMDENVSCMITAIVSDKLLSCCGSGY